MKPKEIDTLIHLLEDPDREIYAAVSGRLIAQGSAVIPALERAWETSPNMLQQERIENILHYLQSNIARQGLENWIGHRYHNLLEGAYWLAKQTYPGLHLEDLQVVINDICKDVWVNMQDDMTPEEKIKTLNYFFFRHHHFRLLGSEELSPQANYINNVMEAHAGNAVSLTFLYLHVGQQAGLPLHAVCLPNSFILAYTDEADNVLFYLHTFQQGTKVSKKDVDLYLSRANISPEAHYYQIKPNTAALLCLLEMQIYCYEHEENAAKAELFRSLLPIFGVEKSTFDDLE